MPILPPHEKMYFVSLQESFGSSEIVELFTNPRHVLKDGSDKSVYEIFLKNRKQVVVKCRFANGMIAALRRFFRRTAFNRELQGLHTLSRLKVHTNIPLAWMVGKDKPGGNTVEAVVLSYVGGPTLLSVLARPKRTIQYEHDLCQAVADEMFLLLNDDHYNRDHKPSNLIVVHQHDCITIGVIDAAGIRLTRNQNESLCKMLASLCIEPAGTGCTPRRSLCMRMLGVTVAKLGASSDDTRSETRRLWRLVQARIEAHGDPTPKVNPLAPPLDVD